MIPRTLFQVWVGGTPVPDQFCEWSVQWKAFHQEWGYVLITDDNVPLLKNQAIYDNAEQIAGRYAGQFRADIIRYEVLYTLGGVYVDMDCEPLRPLDPLLDGVECFVGWEETNRWLNNAVMGSAQFHPFLGALVDGLEASVVANAGYRPNKMSGPQYLTPKWLTGRADVTVYPKDHFYPYLYNELHRGAEEFPDSYVVHHWNNARTNDARVKRQRRRAGLPTQVRRAR